MNYCHTYYTMRFLYILAVSFTKTSFIPFLLWRGLSSYEVHLLYAIFTIGVMFFEVPVSAIGEWIGTRRSFLIGCVCKSTAALIFFAGSKIYHFYIAEIISALGIAFISGTLNAWLMNRINEYDQSKELNTAAIFMIGDRFSKIALALGGAGGAYLAHVHLGYPWVLVGIGFLASFYLAYIYLGGEEHRTDWRKEKVCLRWDWNHILNGYRIAIHNKILLVLVFNGFLVSFALASPKMFWLPYLKHYFNKDMFFLGHMWLCLAGIQFLGTFGMTFSIRVTGSILRLKLLFSLFSSVFFMGIIVFQTNIIYFIVFYLLLECAKPYHESLNLAITHEETSAKGRITFLSLAELIEKLGYTLGLVVVGWISEYHSITWGWSIGLAIYCLIIPCYIYLVYEEWHRHNVSAPAKKMNIANI